MSLFKAMKWVEGRGLENHAIYDLLSQAMSVEEELKERVIKLEAEVDKLKTKTAECSNCHETVTERVAVICDSCASRAGL